MSVVSNLKGEGGFVRINDTSTHGGVFDSIQANADTVIAALVAPNCSGDLTAIPMPAGAIIQGKFTSITLTSGDVMAYNICG